jgi:hypothetical protein
MSSKRFFALSQALMVLISVISFAFILGGEVKEVRGEIF